MREPSWQVWADMLARDIIAAAGDRQVDEYIVDKRFILAVANAAMKARSMLDGNLVLGMTKTEEEGFAEYATLLESLVRIGRALVAGSATDEDVKAWNPLVAGALRAHGDLSYPSEAPGDQGKVH